jgi:hypothetical protein
MPKELRHAFGVAASRKSASPHLVQRLLDVRVATVTASMCGRGLWCGLSGRCGYRKVRAAFRALRRLGGSERSQATIQIINW